MYRILIADDEGLMLEAFKGVILAEFGDKCSVETAKTGRAVIEKAETFHPDIVFMDIHMPGINGIQAMREIRKFNNSALFYVVSAYDKFDYAKEAINLGVEQYLTKPISKSKIISVVEEATAKVDKVRDQRSNLLKIQEKLETVIPVVESGYVNSLLFQKEMAAAGYYQQLLDIEYGQGYVMVVQFGQSYENGRLVSPVGMNVKAQSFYPEFRDVVKSAFPCVVGNIMSNRIPVVVPCEIFQNPYEDRIDLVEKARELVARLEGRLDAKFRVGIGTEIIVSLKSSFFAEIVKCSHNLEGGTWRICTICGSVQKTAVILVVYQIVPIIPNGIGIKIRLAHFYKPFSGRWFHYHNSPSSVTQCIVCNALKIGIQGRYNRISGILLIKELILHLSQKKGMGSQKGKVRL